MPLKKIKIPKKTILLCLLFFLLLMFVFSFHGVDSCTNLRWINAEYNLTLYETYFDGRLITPVDCYRKYMFRMIYSGTIPYLMLFYILTKNTHLKC